MAVIRIDANKDARCTQTVCLVQGDKRTQILRFDVDRYDGGVDLYDMTWVVKTVNAAGVDDVHTPVAVEIGENRISIDWLVDGTVTDASGMASYELNGLWTTDDGEAIVWKGGTGTMSLRKNIGENFGDIDMSNIDRLVLYVEERLQDIVDLTEDLENAGDVANAAADAANTAATTANNATTAANTAAGAATTAANNASAAAEAANAAALPHAILYGLRVRGETAQVSGNPASCLTDAGSLLQPVTVFEPIQDGSGDPSPSNIRPIIGYDKLGLTRAGKNLFNFDGLKNLETTLVGGFYRANKPYLKPGKYAWNGVEYYSDIAGITMRLANSDNSKHWTLVGQGILETHIIIDSTEPLYLEINYSLSAFHANSTLKAQLELGSTASSYLPYQGNTYTVQIGETVYGGKFDWLAGKLTVDTAHLSFNGQESWVWHSEGLMFDASIPAALFNGKQICSHFRSIFSWTGDGIYIDGDVIAVGTGLAAEYGSAEAFKAFLAAQYAAGTPVQIAYRLATPTEIQLTPQIISAAEPEQVNTLYGDGNIEVTYVKPLLESIEEHAGSGGIADEVDPTVPAWAKEPTKPTYTAAEVGAQPAGDYALRSEIPAVPVQSVNGKTGAVVLTHEDVGAASAEEVAALSGEIANITIKGEGAPTEATQGEVGSLYMDTTNGDLYKCTAASEGVYAWVVFSQEAQIEWKEAGEVITGAFLNSASSSPYYTIREDLNYAYAVAVANHSSKYRITCCSPTGSQFLAMFRDVNGVKVGVVAHPDGTTGDLVRYNDYEIEVPSIAYDIVINSYNGSASKYEPCLPLIQEGKEAAAAFVSYEEQSLSETEQAQARTNIGAAAQNDMVATEREMEQLMRRFFKVEQANDFTWGTFDKAYFVFVHDDTNSFVSTAYNAFHAEGAPLSAATVASRIDKVYDEQTAKEWLDLMVADGGEVLMHYNADLMNDSADELWYTHVVEPKRVLENAGFEVRGLTLANASSVNSAKGEKFCRRYYDFADKVGTSTRYNLGRTLMLGFSDLTAFKAYLDTCAQTPGIYAFGFHGLRDDEAWITEESLREIIQYINAKSNVEITTYSAVFDAIGTTALEKRVAALENGN